MGGRGVTIIAPFQSRAQLLARYGEHKTATILNNTGSVLLFGGTRDRDDLQFWSTLAGERDERITTTDLHGRVASQDGAQGAGARAGADREPARREGRGLPPRDRPGHRAGPDGLDPRRRPRPARHARRRPAGEVGGGGPAPGSTSASPPC